MPEVAESIGNSKALKVFVGNIFQEVSAVGKMSISDKLSWMSEMTGVYPDVLLWPAEKEPPENLRCDIHTMPLADTYQPGVHSREALRQGLDEIAGVLFQQS